MLLLLLLSTILDDIVNGMDDSVACEDVIVGQPGSRPHFICIRNNLATNWLADKTTNTARMKKEQIGISNSLMAQWWNWHKSKSWMSWFVADLASAILNTIIYAEITSSRTKTTTTSDCQFLHIQQQQQGPMNGGIAISTTAKEVKWVDSMRISPLPHCSWTPALRSHLPLQLRDSPSKCPAKMMSYDKTRQEGSHAKMSYEKTRS